MVVPNYNELNRLHVIAEVYTHMVTCGYGGLHMATYGYTMLHMATLGVTKCNHV